MAETPKGKPLPEITDQTRPFWSAAKARRLVMQKCGRCAALNFFPKPWCIECGSRALEWTEVRPQGTVYSHTTATAVMMNYPAWKDELPIVICVIDLDDGPRMYGQLTGCPADKLCVGLRVEAYFEDIGDEAAIPKFRPLPAPG